MKRITLCADDYAFNEAVSQGIVALAQQGRLAATSCMANSVYWPEHAKLLQPLIGRIQIGLHFNLTTAPLLGGAAWAKGGQPPKVGALLLQAQLRRLPQQAIVKELHLQLDRFTAALNRTPDFIDGHEHVHHFPVVRDALLAVYEARLRDNAPYIRVAATSWLALCKNTLAPFKTAMIALSGALALKRILVARNIPHNTSFAGIYDFSQAHNYAALFPKFIAMVQDQGLIMCHPGLPSTDETDAIRASRAQEYHYFSSAEYAARYL